MPSRWTLPLVRAPVTTPGLVPDPVLGGPEGLARNEASDVKPKRCLRSFKGADMPKLRIAIVVPVGPT